jgi:HD superfamily phosphodiesterase
MNFPAAQKFILKKMEEELPGHLFYHGLHHTRDVFSAAVLIAKEEGITSATELSLIKTASLYHDSGFTIDYQNHEESGCDLARKTLPEFGFTPDEIEIVCGMIMATKIPQSPKNKLEEILCDADLDYLGRDDFYEIGDTLFSELKFYNKVKDEQQWNKIQVSFLNSHQYYTNFGKTYREEQKQVYLRDLIKVIEAY